MLKGLLEPRLSCLLLLFGISAKLRQVTGW
jgi:hypothetical protein